MTNLELLVRQHQSKAEKIAAQPIDWNKRKNKWLLSLNELMERIQTLLVVSGVPGSNIQHTQHCISEETLGNYEAPGLQIRIGAAGISFEPIASVVLGGYGRVDVSGPNGQMKLIAGDARSFDPEDKTPSYDREWTWTAYPPINSRQDSFRLDDDGLAKLIELVLGSA